MPAFLKSLITLVVLGLALSSTSAQNSGRLVSGDPPVAGLISVSAADENGLVTVSGGVGAVFPGAQVAVRNLYTGDTAYVQAGLNGSFSTTLYGPGNTPFWVSPAENIPATIRNHPGSLPGGPGTIVSGAFPQTPAQSGLVTQLAIDGDVSDWERYLNVALVTPAPVIYALINQNSMYLALAADSVPADYAKMHIVFTLDSVVYSLAVDPRQQQLATLDRIQPNPNTVGTLAVASSQGKVIEVRIPLATINLANPTLENGTLESISFTDANATDLLTISVQQPVPLIEGIDGIVRLNSQLSSDFTRFTVSGSVAQSSQRWLARGRVNQQAFKPGDKLILEMDVSLSAPELPPGLVGLQMIGQIRLQPLIGADGRQTAGGVGSNNGWSDVLTPSGLPITNLRGDFLLSETSTPANAIIRRNGNLVFPLDFVVQLPKDLPKGMYVPLFEGFGQVADGEIFRWQDNSPLGTGKGAAATIPTRMPLVLNIGDVTNAHLVWTLFQDNPSAGSRGLLASEDQGQYALTNRVHLDNPTYILPPSQAGTPNTYPIEPYLLNQMPNDYDETAVPLIPFLFPGGRLNARITRPDGQVDDLGSSAIIQSQLSTPTLDEREKFGGQSEVDVYRLTTLNPLFTNYVFSQYGEYSINLTGNLEDVWGNRYEGGGTYTVLIAEPLSILPGVLPGTPFEVGNIFNPGVHLSAGAPADVTIKARIYPLDGSAVIEHTISGTSNAAGYFQPTDKGFTFDTPGEYVVDYEARYTDADGHLWAGSLRSAGVIANPSGALIAHGERGLDGDGKQFHAAWFSVRQYAPESEAWLNYPYHIGDVAWVADGVNGHIKPILQVQDTVGTYANWLWNTFPGYQSASGANVPNMIARQELPVTEFTDPTSIYSLPLKPDTIISQGYTYLNAVTPSISARQFIQGDTTGGLPLYWDMDDPYNGQAGAGITGSRPGDYFFLFGGAVVRNQQANIQDTSIYASLGVVIDEKNDPLGSRVFPPYRGEAGGPNGGALLTVNGKAVNLFFHPTGTKPGDVLHVGDTLSIAGQLAPTLPSVVDVSITSPSGVNRQFSGTASSIGYFYDPSQDFSVDEPGVWTVAIQAHHDGTTSAGKIEPPSPTGGILGTDGGQFSVYVLAEDSEALVWNDTRSDFPIPAAVPYNFNFPLPDDWTNIQVFHTVKTASYVLDEGPLHPNGRSFSYQYNPTNLSKNFLNLENNGAGSGAASSDVVTLTFVATATDGNGRFQIRSRTYTIAHDRLTTFG